MSLVRYETDGAVAIITLDRPPVNALSVELIADLATAAGRAADASVRAVVITGAPHFAAGADIAAAASLTPVPVVSLPASSSGWRCAASRHRPKPVIAAFVDTRRGRPRAGDGV
jgi:enoyl-CoA hydratase/carnithine racemase